MSVLHVTWGPGADAMGPWREAPDTWPETVITDCCCCREPRERVRVSVEVQTEPSWYEPIVQVECKPDFGCNANQRRRIGAGNRRAMFS